MLPSVTKPKREFIRVEDQSASNFSYHFQELDILSRGIWTILPWVFSSLNHINEVSPTLQINHFQKVDDSWISSYPLSFRKILDCDDSLSVTEQAWREVRGGGAFKKYLPSMKLEQNQTGLRKQIQSKKNLLLSQQVGILLWDINHMHPLWKQIETYCSPAVLH